MDINSSFLGGKAYSVGIDRGHDQSCQKVADGLRHDL